MKGKKAFCFNGHDKKTPSLVFYNGSNTWYCFGCGAGGDNISLVQSIKVCDFKSACSWLAINFGITSGKIQRKLQQNTYAKQNNAKHNDDQYKPDSEVYEWLINSCALSAIGYNYLVNERKYNDTTINHFNLKDIESPKAVFSAAMVRWGLERLLQCGIAKRSDDNIVNFVWWSHVILFPFYNKDGKIIYLQGRQIGNREPRYISLNKLKPEIFHMNILSKLRDNDIIYICEGLTDVLFAFQNNLSAVGIVGANGFKEECAQRFINYRIRIIPDSDAAGYRFAESIKNAFYKIGKSVQVINLPIGMDLSDLNLQNARE